MDSANFVCYNFAESQTEFQYHNYSSTLPKSGWIARRLQLVFCSRSGDRSCTQCMVICLWSILNHRGRLDICLYNIWSDIYRENSLRKIDCLSFSENEFIEENAASDRNWQKSSITLVAVVFRPLVAVGPREKTDHSIAVPRAYHQWPGHLWFDIDIAWDPNFIDFHHSFILISCELPYETVIWY